MLRHCHYQRCFLILQSSNLIEAGIENKVAFEENYSHSVFKNISKTSSTCGVKLKETVKTILLSSPFLLFPCLF